MASETTAANPELIQTPSTARSPRVNDPTR